MLKKIATAVFINLKHSTSSLYINVARNCILLSPSLAVWVLRVSRFYIDSNYNFRFRRSGCSPLHHKT